jgi:integrase
MTNPRLYKEGIPKTKENIDKEATKELKERGILTNEEIDLMLKQTDKIKFDYFRLSAKALICIVKKFGKRRSEISRLGIEDLNFLPNELEITFHLSKKHKRGLHQFFRVCKKTSPVVLEKPLPEIKQLWQTWQKTEEGHTIKNAVSLQSISLDDKYAAPIIEYYQYIKNNYQEAKFLFPSGKTVFGETYVIFPDRPLSGSQLLRIIKPLKSDVWLHLFRETKGAEIAKAYGRTLNAIYEVKDSLDLENEETAYRYVRRYVAKKQEVER